MRTGPTNRHPRPPAVPTSTEPTRHAEPPEADVPNPADRGASTTLDQFRADLRSDLIERFRNDEMSRAELNQVLRRFGLPTCDGPIRVHYTLTGHVEIDVPAGDAGGDGVDRASCTVGVDLTQIDMLVDGSSQHDALVKVYPSVPVGVVLYTVSGHYDVTAPDTGSAAADANSYLYPDLSGLVGVRDGTDHFEVRFRTEVR